MTYEQYIQTFWAGDVTGKCAEATTSMVQMFPELRRVRGFYCCPLWGRREHWWLVAPDGSIVDPTVRQFPGGGLGDYQEWTEGDFEPVGKCINCGEYVYQEGIGGVLCNEACERELRLSMGY